MRSKVNGIVYHFWGIIGSLWVIKSVSEGLTTATFNNVNGPAPPGGRNENRICGRAADQLPSKRGWPRVARGDLTDTKVWLSLDQINSLTENAADYAQESLAQRLGVALTARWQTLQRLDLGEIPLYNPDEAFAATIAETQRLYPDFNDQLATA